MQGYGALCFGPINSRRFGKSLGLDLIGPHQEKKCNFDCLYCELPKGERTSKPANLPTISELLKALQEKLQEYPDADVVTLCGNGEPTLHPELKQIIIEVKKIIGARPLLILSNGSTICDKSVQDALMLCDIVKLSLDSARDESLKKIDRPENGFSVKNIIEAMASFRKEFKKELVIEILLVDGVNDSDLEIEPLKNALLTICPDKIHLGTIARSPAYKVKPVTKEKLENFASKLAPLAVSIA